MFKRYWQCRCFAQISDTFSPFMPCFGVLELLRDSTCGSFSRTCPWASGAHSAQSQKREGNLVPIAGPWPMPEGLWVWGPHSLCSVGWLCRVTHSRAPLQDQGEAILHRTSHETVPFMASPPSFSVWFLFSGSTTFKNHLVWETWHLGWEGRRGGARETSTEQPCPLWN